jgi:hypothetical protein
MTRLLQITTLLVSMGAFSLPTLHADVITYDVDFTTTAGTPQTPTGSFTYDTVAQQFDSFTVDVGSLDFDLTSSANSPGAFPGCLTAAGGAGFYSFLESEGAGCQPGDRWSLFAQPGIGSSFSFGAPDTPVTGFAVIAFANGPPPAGSGPGTFGEGVFSIDLVPSPEPGTFVLTGGILLPFVFLFSRRRAAVRPSEL